MIDFLTLYLLKADGPKAYQKRYEELLSTLEEAGLSDLALALREAYEEGK